MSNAHKDESTDRGWKYKMLNVVDSKLFLLLLATFLASKWCPEWISPLTYISADRQWKLNLKEKALTSLDEAVLYYLFVLEEQCDDSIPVDKLRETRRKALIEMNKSLVQLRLVYGSKIMEEVKKDLPIPIGDLYQEAIKCKSDKKKMDCFKLNLKNQLKNVEAKVNYWEDRLSKPDMVGKDM
ncbi:MAG: hypothetical protein FD174_1422 [Geobacteraceae bacterium]|nr:MAG: hypothetical protein FD174_1422 [Geobacteraceae bacterium]